MKKCVIISLLILAGVMNLKSQSQRMVLFEEFSNASCSPCASANPTINLLIKNNPTKIVPIKYQTNWPGFDPMNVQNPTEVATRVSYYGVTGVPAVKIDGTTQNYTQAVIDAEYAIPAPFSISISHTFNETFDSVNVQCVVTASQNFSSTQLKLHIAMIEKEIKFDTAPGANGEKTFSNVMRKMYPDASGRALQNDWTSGQAQTVQFSAKIPTYIYDLNQIYFIAFIQSNTDKKIQQAAKDEPQELNNYIKILSHNFPKEPGCYEQIPVQLVVKNQGPNTINSFDVEYGIIGSQPLLYSYSTPLPTNQSVTLNLEQVTVPSGSSVIYAQIKNPNQQTSYPTLHTRVEAGLSQITEFSDIPVTENFAATNFPPENWYTLSYDEAAGWHRATTGSGSALMDFFNSPSGQIDLMYLKPINLTEYSSVDLTFDVAYARYSATYSDALRVQVSTNCGQSWAVLYNKSGSTLATAPDATSSFVPTSSQWRKETISLNNYVGKPEVLIRFYALSGYGNNLYVDNVNITSTASISKYNIDEDGMIISPNPVTDIFSVEISKTLKGNTFVTIYDELGKVVKHEMVSFNNNKTEFNCSAWQHGIYFVTIQDESATYIGKVLKQ